MSNFSTYRTEEESPSSDEKMDIGSDTFPSQSTNSDSEDVEARNPQVLRLTAPGPGTHSTQSSYSDELDLNPDERLEPETKLEINTQVSESNITSSLTTKMSALQIDTPKITEEKKIGISPPRFSSTLTTTTSHPLMGLGSPEFPDVVPKQNVADKSLSIDANDTNGFYSPQRNTSKNNLYFSEFVTADSIDSLELGPDVARVRERRKIVPRLDETPRSMNRNFEGSKVDCAMRITSHSTPKCVLDDTEEYHSGVADWTESPSQLRAMPNFELPIEMSSSLGQHHDLDSPDVVSSSTQEEKSAYQALLDPYTGSVALRHTPRNPKPISPAVTRRKIRLPVEDDQCSLDSLSDASLESEEEPAPPETRTGDPQHSDEEDTKRSRSTCTASCSDSIPEYSLAEELSNERAWLAVRDGSKQLCDMKVIEPYKRVVSHGGYSGGLALVVFSACYLPDNSRRDYTYVMDNLFLYVMWTLERLVTEEYVVVYFHGRAGGLPAARWLHHCYKLVTRRLRKSLKHLYLVHPTFWLKSFVIITKPFVSSKFFRKMSYIKSLDELMEQVPVEPNAIPEVVKQYDASRKR